MDNPMPTAETAERITAMQDSIGRNLPPPGTYARAGAELPPAPPAEYATKQDIERLTIRYGDLLEAMRETLALIQTPAAVPLSERLKSRKLFAFIAGLLIAIGSAIVTATQSNVDGAITLGGMVAVVAPAIVVYIHSQGNEDAARHQAESQVKSAHIMTGRRGPPEA
jgi:hypothetical protein